MFIKQRDELIYLANKAQTQGLTFEEKMRFAEIKPYEPKCKCATKGDQCKLHAQNYTIMENQ